LPANDVPTGYKGWTIDYVATNIFLCTQLVAKGGKGSHSTEYLLAGFAVLVIRTSEVRVGQAHGIVRSERLEANNGKAGKRVHAEEVTADRKDAENPRQRSKTREAVGQIEVGEGLVGSFHHGNLLAFSRREEDEHNPRIGEEDRS